MNARALYEETRVTKLGDATAICVDGRFDRGGMDEDWGREVNLLSLKVVCLDKSEIELDKHKTNWFQILFHR